MNGAVSKTVEPLRAPRVRIPASPLMLPRKKRENFRVVVTDANFQGSHSKLWATRFMGNSGEMEGHSALISSIVQNKDGTITLNTLSVLAADRKYGEKQFTLTKDKNGNWVANNGLTFRGYSQMHNTKELQSQKKVDDK